MINSGFKNVSPENCCFTSTDKPGNKQGTACAPHYSTTTYLVLNNLSVTARISNPVHLRLWAPSYRLPPVNNMIYDEKGRASAIWEPGLFPSAGWEIHKDGVRSKNTGRLPRTKPGHGLPGTPRNRNHSFIPCSRKRKRSAVFAVQESNAAPDTFPAAGNIPGENAGLAGFGLQKGLF